MKKSILIQLQKIYEKYFVPLNEGDKQKITAYFYITITLLAVSFFAFFAIGPTLNTVSSLNKQYEDNMLVYNSLQTKLKNLKTLDGQYLTIQGNVNEIYNAIPRSTQIPQLTRQLENIAAENSLAVDGLTFGKVEVYPYSDKIPIYSYLFTVNVSGEKANIDTFLSKVINFNRIVGIERVTMGRNAEGQSTLSFTGRAFFSPK